MPTEKQIEQYKVFVEHNRGLVVWLYLALQGKEPHVYVLAGVQALLLIFMFSCPEKLLFSLAFLVMSTTMLSIVYKLVVEPRWLKVVDAKYSNVIAQLTQRLARLPATKKRSVEEIVAWVRERMLPRMRGYRLPITILICGLAGSLAGQWLTKRVVNILLACLLVAFDVALVVINSSIELKQSVFEGVVPQQPEALAKPQ